MSEEVTDIIYHISLRNQTPTSSVSLDSAYTYTSHNNAKFYGSPGDRATVMLETIDVRSIVFPLHLILQECPPGFVLNKANEDKIRCECSALTEKQFLGIRNCDNDAFQALLIRGYWMNYSKEALVEDPKYGKEKYLLHAACPIGQCVGNNEKSSYLLPETTSFSALDDVVCGSNRTGILCSHCRKGYAPHYHHSTYACKDGRKSCKIGWLLFFASEIAPVALFFVIVMVFNIKFTDGYISGIILFVQLTDTMLIQANGFVQFPKCFTVALNIYRFITRIFNLNFFANDRFSFCLWSSASTLDLLAMKYVTIFFALTLVALIITVFKYCHSKRMNSLLVRLRGGSAASTKSDIIHGMSGFLVICYSECTRISLLLLTPVQLYNTGYRVERVSVFYDGELTFFRGKHLLYALPALVILLVLGIFPPLMLISYPLCYKIFALFKINNTKFTKVLCLCLPLEKFKPFFDSFQCSFKDEYRYFSGLYFLYRFTTLATFAFLNYLSSYYLVVQLQLATILTLHSLCQPYKKRWHNVLDALLFLNLSIINAITLFNFSLSFKNITNQRHINRASYVQIILLFLPLLYVLIYSTGKQYSVIKATIVLAYRRAKGKTKVSSQPTATVTEYRQFSSSFPLDIAENRLRDNEEAQQT